MPQILALVLSLVGGILAAVAKEWALSATAFSLSAFFAGLP